MYTEDDLIPVSALQHAMFCERQVALIHVEQLWAENLYTAQGRALHERVDQKHHESRRTTRTENAMPIRSLAYGLIGIADVVELERTGNGRFETVRPIEFKRGRKKPNDVDRVQLCAQALCLEEMFGVSIREGQFYYLQEHRRSSVEIDDILRTRTVELAVHVHDLLAAQVTPVADYNKEKCDRCSLIELCMPKTMNHGGKKVSNYVVGQLRAQGKVDAT